MRRKRTLKRYAELFRNPEILFPGGPNSLPVRTVIFPNGENEIWFKTQDGLGLRIRVSNGKAGLGMQIDRFTYGTEISVTGNAPGDCAPVPMQDFSYVEICQYRQDKASQDFKLWYASDNKESKGFRKGEGEL